MKKSFLFLLGILFLTQSCSDSNISYSLKKDCNFSEEGTLHNQFMDDVLDELIEKGESGKLSTCEDGVRILDKLFKDYSEQNFGEDATQSVLESVVPNKYSYWELDKSEINTLFDKNGIDQSIFDHLNLVASFEYKRNKESIYEYIGRLEAYVDNFPVDVKTNEIFANSFLIRKSSLCYWENNLSKWVEKIELSIPSRDWKDREEDGDGGLGWLGETIWGMAESDFWSGAVGTLVGGPAVGVAGACYGSAARGVKELFD